MSTLFNTDKTLARASKAQRKPEPNAHELLAKLVKDNKAESSTTLAKEPTVTN